MVVLFSCGDGDDALDGHPEVRFAELERDLGYAPRVSPERGTGLAWIHDAYLLRLHYLNKKFYLKPRRYDNF